MGRREARAALVACVRAHSAPRVRAGVPEAPGCELVWDGVVRERAFQTFELEVVHSEAAGRKLLESRSLGHLWDLAAAHGRAAEGAEGL